MPHDHASQAREDGIRLRHMLEAAERVARYCEGLNREALEADEMRYLAVIKSIEVIGEAANKVSPVSQGFVPDVDWLGIRRMRNRLIHGYDSVDPARVWDAVEIDIPKLVTALRAALRNWPGQSEIQSPGL